VSQQLNAKYTVVSDGVRLTCLSGDNKATSEEATPADFGSMVCQIITKSGPSPIYGFITTKDAKFEEKVQAFQISEFKELPPEGKSKRLSYGLMNENAMAIRIKVTLWYEPDTGRLLKRTMKITFGDNLGEVNSTETYSEFTLNGDVPDDKFNPSAAVDQPDLYPGTDVVEPRDFELKRALGIRKSEGLLQSGTLEYGGAGDLAKAYQAYVKSMKAGGWEGAADDLAADKITGTLRKDNRICTVEFTKVAAGIQAIIKMGPKK
jgi:hypothetical protein